MKKVIGSIVLVLAAAGFSAAAVNVDVRSPNVSVQVGSPRPAPQVTVIERETVVVKERGDNGKHKGHYKNKKQKKDRNGEKGGGRHK